MSRPQSRRERKKQNVRAEIVARAVELFAERGIDTVTVDQIAEAADIGKGTVYNYFTAKEDIIVAFLVDVEAEVQTKVTAFTSSKRKLDAILVDFVLMQLELKRPYHKFIRVFLAQMFLRTEQFLPHMMKLQEFTDPPLEKLLRTLQQRGALRADANIADLMSVFKTMHLGLTALWAIEGPPFLETERIVKQEMRWFSEGLKGRAI